MQKLVTLKFCDFLRNHWQKLMELIGTKKPKKTKQQQQQQKKPHQLQK